MIVSILNSQFEVVFLGLTLAIFERLPEWCENLLSGSGLVVFVYLVAGRQGDEYVAILLLGVESVFSVFICCRDNKSVADNNVLDTYSAACHLTGNVG